MTIPDLTILVGPYTRLTLAINAAVRSYGAAMNSAGLVALPTRIASPLSRALALGPGSGEERLATFQAAIPAIAEKPVFLSALNFLGAPASAISARDLFPGAAELLSGLGSTVTSPPRMVVGVEPLHCFFATAGSDALAAQVAKTSWETLYEISWADLVEEIRQCVPEAEIAVITPESGMLRPQFLSHELFGPAAQLIPTRAFQDAHLTTEGQAALSQITPEQATEPVLRELYEKLGNVPGRDALKTRFGIDGLTATLLTQRFEEDIESLAEMEGVRLL